MHRIKDMQEIHGNLHEIIPALVNKNGQHRTAAKLGVGASTINRWLKDNGYVREVRYVRQESEGKGK